MKFKNIRWNIEMRSKIKLFRTRTPYASIGLLLSVAKKLIQLDYYKYIQRNVPKLLRFPKSPKLSRCVYSTIRRAINTIVIKR